MSTMADKATEKNQQLLLNKLKSFFRHGVPIDWAQMDMPLLDSFFVAHAVNLGAKGVDEIVGSAGSYDTQYGTQFQARVQEMLSQKIEEEQQEEEEQQQPEEDAEGEEEAEEEPGEADGEEDNGDPKAEEKRFIRLLTAHDNHYAWTQNDVNWLVRILPANEAPEREILEILAQAKLQDATYGSDFHAQLVHLHLQPGEAVDVDVDVDADSESNVDQEAESEAESNKTASGSGFPVYVETFLSVEYYKNNNHYPTTAEKKKWAADFASHYAPSVATITVLRISKWFERKRAKARGDKATVALLGLQSAAQANARRKNKKPPPSPPPPPPRPPPPPPPPAESLTETKVKTEKDTIDSKYVTRARARSRSSATDRRKSLQSEKAKGECSEDCHSVTGPGKSNESDESDSNGSCEKDITLKFGLEPAIRQGGKCLSCDQPIAKGSTRVTVQWPFNVQYVTQTAQPKVYMHPQCFIDHPFELCAPSWANLHKRARTEGYATPIAFHNALLAVLDTARLGSPDLNSN
jgi:hypothetical protein